jgi:hypothetical protein
MIEHLSHDQIKELSDYKLKGIELLYALNHIEECEGCRQKIKSPAKAEILANLFSDDEPVEKDNSFAKDSDHEMVS